MDAVERETMILALAPIVRWLARQVAGRRRDIVEDLVGEGWLGAISAVDKYEQGRGANIATFAAPRIRGSMLDYLRRQALVRRVGYDAVPEDDPRRQAPAEFDPAQMPPSTIDTAQLAADHVDAVHYLKMLPERNRQIVAERHMAEATLVEVANRHDMTESRVCQIAGRDIKATARTCQRCGRSFEVLGIAKPKLCKECRREIHSPYPKRRRAS